MKKKLHLAKKCEKKF